MDRLTHRQPDKHKRQKTRQTYISKLLDGAQKVGEILLNSSLVSGTPINPTCCLSKSYISLMFLVDKNYFATKLKFYPDFCRVCLSLCCAGVLLVLTKTKQNYRYRISSLFWSEWQSGKCWPIFTQYTSILCIVDKKITYKACKITLVLKSC